MWYTATTNNINGIQSEHSYVWWGIIMVEKKVLEIHRTSFLPYRISKMLQENLNHIQVADQLPHY